MKTLLSLLLLATPVLSEVAHAGDDIEDLDSGGKTKKTKPAPTEDGAPKETAPRREEVVREVAALHHHSSKARSAESWPKTQRGGAPSCTLSFSIASCTRERSVTSLSPVTSAIAR